MDNICVLGLGLVALLFISKKKEPKVTISKEDSNNDIKFSVDTIKNKYDLAKNLLGSSYLNLNISKNKDFVSALWQVQLDKYSESDSGKFAGLDYIKIDSHISRKHHPTPADVYISVGKYMNVPEHLYGAIKYASPTINLEELKIPKIYNEEYSKTGTKEKILVTGSCASVTISAITIKFVEDMIEKYSNINNVDAIVNKKFRDEYNKRILGFLCGKGIEPAISWYDPIDFNEEKIVNTNNEKCSELDLIMKGGKLKRKNFGGQHCKKRLHNVKEEPLLESQNGGSNCSSKTAYSFFENEEKIEGGYDGGEQCSFYNDEADCDPSSCYWDGSKCKAA